MTLLNTLLASSAVALGVLVQTAVPVTASGLTPIGSNHAARHAAISSGHGGMAKRKRNSHKNRKRCIQPPNPGTLPPSGGDNGGNNNGGNTGGGSTPPVSTPPANIPPNNGPACSTGGKVGLGWGPSMPSNFMPNAITGKTCYYYNWSSWAADKSLSKDLIFVPMLWGWGHNGDFTDNVINNPTNYGVAIGMNEVNQDGQSRMDVGTGLQWWRDYMLPLRWNKGYRLGSPSTTNAPDGLQWLGDWTNQLADNERPDFYTLHWYGTTADDFINYVNTAINQFNKPVWITEFACTDFGNLGWQCNVDEFANRVIPFLDNNPQVQAYFPFAFVNEMSGVNEVNRLMWDGGVVTPVGWRYLA